MNASEDIGRARSAHEVLRAGAVEAGRKGELYGQVKSVLDQAWAAAPDDADVGSAVRSLTVDAQYHAGLSDAEGFRDEADMRAQYDLLERRAAARTSSP